MAKLFFRYSAMNAGKSTSLLQIAYNYEEQGQAVQLFTAGIDDRSGRGSISSRLGLQRPASVFDADTDFLALLTPRTDLACVLIDESQFLTPVQVRQLHQIAHTVDIPTICFGLRSDFQGNPFPGAAYLLTLADDIEEIKTICACGRKATMNIRIDAQGRRVCEGQQVEIGGNERYRQACARCFYQEADNGKI
ncbi:MAG: thymidine kinase [Curvibacter sp. RIFCSPHIGHO2_12_FULL_63_18]|uniref:thymidine kinase n=1 Tax=Rhodoferax sp. TaxID=50421 RepID=UPI0008D4C961|nr:thymidine kinase [Rhodoferax sp.]OGO97025.1 MAG: thymidine kinase [Curvibacter sp. GWA2_63_95]OGP01202.1 MAG: thymidine kinase [Curvibacter sp. RIFCSPHIGHO2_12_FULL_63_18]HCX80019.1 thymidine kinase [Rhodoferax sp.]